MTLKRKKAVVEEEKKADTDISPVTSSHEMHSLPSAKPPSLLGLQKTMTLNQKHAVVEEEEDKVVPVQEEEEEVLAYEDLSLLGLQRSTTVVRRQATQNQSTGAQEQPTLSIFEV